MEAPVIQKIAIPLFKLEVTDLVRHGTRWSALEHLLLWACKKPRTTAELADDTGMPIRLVSESLLNLLRVGWVELHITAAATHFSAGRPGGGKAHARSSTRDQD
jgi:cardiolipin synthase A/B